MRRLRRLILWGFLGLGFLGLLVLAFRPAPVRVDLGRVTRGPLRVTVEAEGKTRVRQRYRMSAPVTGRLVRPTLEEGDAVEPEMVVARIDPLPIDADLRAAQARLAELRAQRAGVETLRPKAPALAQARARARAAEAAQREAEARVVQVQATLEQARRDLERAQRLEAVGALSREERERVDVLVRIRRQEFEAARLEAQRAAAEVKAAVAALAVLQAQQRDPDYLLNVYDARIASVETELDKLRDRAVRTDVRAPIRGQVLRLFEAHERVVSAGTPLLEIGDPHDLEVVVDVLSSDAVRIRPGALMELSPWDGAPDLRARVRRLEPAAFTKISSLGVEEQRVNVIGDFIDPPEDLGDRYRVEARIVVWEAPDVVKVPVSALFRCPTGWCVFAVEAAVARQRPVRIGARNDQDAEVQDGLVPGDTVVLHPGAEVDDGIRIRPR